MDSPEIRERFLNFFDDRGHHRLPSASLVTHDDPSVLFTVAGMVPLKPYILGVRTPPAARLTSCQKCFRGSGMRDDIAEVGDTTHHTFFEMLGNWSFGDYFKEGAIDLAWELLTSSPDAGGYGLDPDRLWPSVYPTDTVSEEIWVNRVGVPRSRISRLEENWWQAGPTGPCGYDSEVYYDRGGPCSCGRTGCTPQDECGGDRWVEIWNLVFMEFEQHEDGTRTPLPNPVVDTGMGLERITAVLQGVRSNYETDLFKGIVDGYIARAGVKPDTPQRQMSFNILADHLRSAAFLVADGVTPSNEGRGYALRRVIRRAAVHGRRVGLQGGLAAGLPDLVEVMGSAYPELRERQQHVERSLSAEEESFARTLSDGAARLEALIEGGASRIDGGDAFRLYDTFGFPVELTVELARERGVEVDIPGYHAAMLQQRERSRKGTERVGFTAGPALPPSTFVGYEKLETESEVIWTQLGENGEGQVVLEPTPFYAESGGQVGDRGTLQWDDGWAEVLDTQFMPGTDTRASTLRVTRGHLREGMRVLAAVDFERRAQTARHHSATHLLHKSLREVLGDEVVQRGSLVDDEHTTFDFAFSRALSAGEIRDVQHRVNAAIRRDLQRTTTVMPIEEARRTGAVALFGEKYGEEVRVVDFGGWSRELCGGTHVQHTGELGAAIIAAESSIGQGTRRIEMVVGESAERYWTDMATSLREAAQQLRVKPEEVPQRVIALQQQVRQLQRDVVDARRHQAGRGGVEGAEVEELGSVRFAHLLMNGGSGADAGDVKTAADSLFAERLQADGVALVIGHSSLAVKVGGGAQQSGVRAGDLARVAAEATGAKGGGRPDFAAGGVGDPERRADALDAVRRALGGGATPRVPPAPRAQGHDAGSPAPRAQGESAS
ncbi:MAG TPA: alanine--tRNA ligase [Candidatus Dormibacteraeota bacterium]|nr:alanine--tRNA ligase [Candidatus Dormibacteraeota bacterium]